MGDDAAKIPKLLRPQTAIANFGSVALRQTDLLTVLSEAARVQQNVRYPLAAENDHRIEAGRGW
jgi:hypothetical protein